MKKRLSALILPAASGVLMGLAVSYLVPALFEWAAMAPFLFTLFSDGGKGKEKESVSDNGNGGGKLRGLVKEIFFGWRRGFTYFYPYYLTVWHWFLSMYPLDFTGISKGSALAAILAAWLGLPFLQAFCASWQVPVYNLASRSRIFCGARGRFLKPLLYAAVYTVFEWTQILTWAGVPWGRLAIGQAYTPILVQSAALFGSYFVTFIITAVNGYIAFAVLEIKDKFRAGAVISIVLAAAVFASNLIFSGAVALLREEDYEGELITIGILQGNVSSKDKWRDGSFENLSSIYGRLTADAASDGADIVLWSESSLPYTLNKLYGGVNFVESVAEKNNVTLLATSMWLEPDGEKYNSVMTVTPGSGIDTENIYHKQRLVPFGEFIPYENFVKAVFPPLSELSMLGNSVSSGGGASVQMTDMGPIGTLVCFDSIYEEYAMQAVRDGAELLTISTNDSWFGTSAALYQHTAQGVLRAIETDRYVARSANTGYSCVISPSGEIIAEMPVETEGYLIADVYGRCTVTLYSRIGNVFVVVCAAFAVFAAADGVIYNKMKRNGKRKT